MLLSCIGIHNLSYDIVACLILCPNNNVRMDEVLFMIAYVWIAIKSVIIVPLALIFVYQYYKFSNDIFIRNRRPNLALLNNIVIIYYLAIHSTVYIIIEIHFRHNVEQIYAYTFNAVGINLCFLTFIIRGWQLFFDLRYNEDVTDNVWKSALDSHFKSWFIRHRTTYGQPRFILIISAITFIVIEVVLVIIGYFDNADAQNVTQLILQLLGVLFIAIIISKFKDVDDSIAIRGELTLQLKLTMIGTFITLMVVITTVLYQQVVVDENSYYASQSHARLQMAITFSILPCIAIASLLFVSTTWVLYHFMCYILVCHESKHVPQVFLLKKLNKFAQKSKTHENIDNTNNNHCADAKPHVKITMQKFLSTQRGFKIFVRTLCKEYAVENLLFILEASLLKFELLKLIRQWNRKSVKHLSDDRLDIVFPQQVLPNFELFVEYRRRIQKSASVTSYDSNGKYLSILILDLYCKYINYKTACWQINISAKSLKQIKHALKGIGKQRRIVMSKQPSITFSNQLKFSSRSRSNSMSLTIDTNPSEFTLETNENGNILFINAQLAETTIKAINSAMLDVIQGLKSTYARLKTTHQYDDWYKKEANNLPKSAQDLDAVISSNDVQIV